MVMMQSAAEVTGNTLLHPRKPASRKAKRALMLAKAKLGDQALQHGELRTALVAFRDSLELAKSLFFQNMTAAAKTDFAVALSKVGDVATALGYLSDADLVYSVSVRIEDQRHSDTPDLMTKRDLSITLNKLAGIKSSLGDLDTACYLYAHIVKLTTDIYHETQSGESARDLSQAYTSLGNSQLQQGYVVEALKAYQTGIDVLKPIIFIEETEDLAHLQDQATYLDLIGICDVLQGQIRSAGQVYFKCLKIKKQILAQSGSVEAYRDLSSSWNNVGTIALHMGDIHLALAAHLKGLKIRQGIAQEHNTPGAYRDLCVSHYRIFRILLENSSKEQAQFHYEQAVRYAQHYKSRSHNGYDAQKLLDAIQTSRGQLNGQ